MYRLLIVVSTFMLMGCDLLIEMENLGASSTSLAQVTLVNVEPDGEGGLHLTNKASTLEQTNFKYGSRWGSSIDSSDTVVNFGSHYHRSRSSDSTYSNVNQYAQSHYDESTGWLWVVNRTNTLGGTTTTVLLYDTQNTSDLSDDEFVGVIDSTLLPGLSVIDGFDEVNYDPTNNLLYIGSRGTDATNALNPNSGVAVINTQGTRDLSDDVLVGVYNSTLMPALVNWSVADLTIVPGWDGLIVSTFFGDPLDRDDTGVYIINRNGTETLADDVLEISYNEFSSPAVRGISFQRVQYDPATQWLLIASTRFGGFTGIDTQGTMDPSDDTLAFEYDETTTPTLINNGSTVFDFDGDDGILVINTLGAFGDPDTSVQVIDTQLTASRLDDVVIGTYKFSGTILELGSVNNNILYSRETGQIFFSGTTGLEVVSLNDYANPVDDTLVSYPHISSIWLNFFVAQDQGALYVPSYTGFNVFPLNSSQVTRSSFASEPFPISGYDPLQFEVGADIPEGANLTVQYQTGSSATFIKDEFDDGVQDKFQDLYFWGAPDTVTESDGTVKIYGRTGANNAYIWYNPGVVYPQGTKFRIRYRLVTGVTNPFATWVHIFDSFNYSLASDNTTNEWKELELTTGIAGLGFGIDMNCVTVVGWNPITDYMEVDWIVIEAPNSVWDSPPVATLQDGYYRMNPEDLDGKDWVRYIATVDKPDTLSSNVQLTKVGLSEGFESNGSILYETYKLRANKVVGFTVDAETPPGTSYEVLFSKDQGVTWETIAVDSEGFGKVEQTKGTMTFQVKLLTTNSHNSAVIKNFDVEFATSGDD
ncbi:MAG: hypothetical protein HRT44_06770 [Bdellovibrionales bacterium]|nr:hypothetical protein [Bdellovibrionales bacterium]